jgi:glycosyltransferase involved in cell wall biosynthesis
VTDAPKVRTTVVVPAYRAWRTLPRALEALRAEVDRPDRELILVESSGRLAAEELERRWPWAIVVALPTRTLPGTARNLAIARARGELIAFTDADALAEPGWLDELERNLRPGIDAVAGGIVNGTPESAIGTSGFLLEFADWLPERPGSPRHGATCNLLVRRGALERSGGFPSDLWPGEDTVFTFRLGEEGRLTFAPGARVRHLNRTGLLDYLRHQVRLGFSFSEVCRRTEFPHGQYTRLPLAPLTGVVRAARLWRRLSRWHLRPPTSALLPLVLAGATAWAAGLTAAAVRRAPGTR